SIARGERRAPRPDRFVNAFLALEMVVDQRRADADARRDILQRDAVVAELGEELLGGIENARDGGFADAGLVVASTRAPRRRGARRGGFVDVAHRDGGCRPATGASTLYAEKPMSSRQPRPCWRRLATSASAKANAPGVRLRAAAGRSSISR